MLQLSILYRKDHDSDINPNPKTQIYSWRYEYKKINIQPAETYQHVFSYSECARLAN